MASGNYSDNVFINCPFDRKYRNMFRACVFTVLDSGFLPRCSLETNNAAVFRLQAIVDLIEECCYGIHDISRVQLDTGSRLPRFNMPFELGVFYGAKQLGATKHMKKECIILEKEQYRYQQFLSDLAGVDVTPHYDSQQDLINAVRDWLATASKRSTIPQGKDIVKRFGQFEEYIKKACKMRSIAYSDMTFIELVRNMTDWLKYNQACVAPLITSKPRKAKR